MTTGTSALAQLQATIDEHQQSLISTTNVTDPTSLAISTAEGHQIVTVGESLASTAATDTNTAQAEQYLVADGGVPISEIVGSETGISLRPNLLCFRLFFTLINILQIYLQTARFANI